MAKRRKRGDGTVYRTKDGQWWARIPIGDGRVRKARVDSAQDGAARLKAWRAELDQGVDLRASQERLDAFLERWLRDLQAREAVRPGTLEFYARHAGYAADLLGHLPLERLEARHWRDAQAAMRKAGLSRRSVNHAQSVLHNAFKMAIADGALASDPFAAVKRLPLGSDAFEAHALTDAEVGAFLSACAPERLGILFRFILDHGVRHGEARALKWADVILDGDRPAFQIRDAKSKAGRRRIPLTAAWVTALTAHRARLDEERAIAERLSVERARAGAPLVPGWVDHDLVFPSERGTTLNEQNVIRVKQRVLVRAGLCDPCAACGQTGEVKGERCAACRGRGALVWRIRIHDLRHTAITDWIASGANPRTAQALAGHSDPMVTMRIYAKSREALEREALEETAQQRQKQQQRKDGTG